MGRRLLRGQGAERKQEMVETDSRTLECLKIIRWGKVKAFSLTMNGKALLS